MNLWTQQTAADATGGKAQGTWQAGRVEIDSRRVQPGDLFIALKGENFDGHHFIGDALAKGASAVMVDRASDVHTPLLLVNDTQRALENLARFARERSRAKVIGVTGSVGKTSTKEMIKLALSAHGLTHATAGNYNNHIGTPLTLANLSPDAVFAVCEMGMNHAGEISPLSKMVRPDIAVITNIEAVHMEFFDAIENIADAKAEIFDGVGRDGHVLLNSDSPFLAQLKKAATTRGVTHIFTCGEAVHADYQLLHYHPVASGCGAMMHYNGKEKTIRLGAVGKQWMLTAIFALAICDICGLDMDKSIQAIAAFKELVGRGQITHLSNGAILIDDSYNASPASMRAAFIKTSEVWEGMGKKGRKLAALGDMRELGKDTPALHAALAGDLRDFHSVFTAGESMQYLYDALPAAVRAGHAANAEALLPVLMRVLKPDDILLVKGSHGSHMYEVANALLHSKEQKHAV